jgi:hypothetical protein
MKESTNILTTPPIFHQYQYFIISKIVILQILLPSFWTRGLSRYYRLKCGHEDPIVASKCIAQQIGQQNERRPRRPWDAMGPDGHHIFGMETWKPLTMRKTSKNKNCSTLPLCSVFPAQIAQTCNDWSEHFPKMIDFVV